MPNYCVYNLKAVSKNKESLERLIKIMSYEDPEYYIYRCFECVPCSDEIYDNEDGLYSINITGTVAWSCKSWFETAEEVTTCILGEDHPTYENYHYITLDLLCKRLDIAIDCFGVEAKFQEHFIVDNNGEILVNERVDYYEYVDKETGRVVGEGGFGDEYLEFRDCEDLYVDVKPE